MKENNEEKIRRLLETESIPDEIKPENISRMLEEKAPAKKRNKITRKAGRIAAGAAACAVVCGLGVHYAGQRNDIETELSEVTSDTALQSSEAIAPGGDSGKFTQSTYMNNAEDYSEIYALFEKAAEKSEYYYFTGNYNGSFNDVAGGIVYGEAEGAIKGEINDGAVMEESMEMSEENTLISSDDESASEEKEDFSDTYNQEEGVIEADIAKTDGKYIYYLGHRYDEETYEPIPYLSIAEAENGSFTNSESIDLSADIDFDIMKDIEGDIDFNVSDMYLYNDMIIIIGTANEFGYVDMPVNKSENSASDTAIGHYWVEDEDTIGSFRSEQATFVNVYSTGMNPQLIGSYTQDGRYNDVRITPEGYMYLITDYTSGSFYEIKDADQIESYIPSYCLNTDDVCIPADDILLPDSGLAQSHTISYTVIGSLDLNINTSVVRKDTKAIAGYSGDIYCSGKNLYTAVGRDETAITRISLEGGMITPAAEGTIKGYIKDQFSMSEYDGYFRVATTYEKWEESIGDGVASYGLTGISNYVYVLDMNLNIVGTVGDFGKDETIKSVSFSGDMAYVVTYEQTDPLFSIDLSNPEAPVILDEYKLPGYSTYMQQWDDGQLLGFGVNANEDGIENGVKLVMFDNSDPDNLAELDSYIISMNTNELWLFSQAVDERKSLLIAPEKNLIGVPVEGKYYSETESGYYTSYIFFSFADGKFVNTGEIGGVFSDYIVDSVFNRAVYIDDYVYVLSSERFISADIATLSEKDRVNF